MLETNYSKSHLKSSITFLLPNMYNFEKILFLLNFHLIEGFGISTAEVSFQADLCYCMPLDKKPQSMEKVKEYME